MELTNNDIKEILKHFPLYGTDSFQPENVIQVNHLSKLIPYGPPAIKECLNKLVELGYLQYVEAGKSENGLWHGEMWRLTPEGYNFVMD